MAHHPDFPSEEKHLHTALAALEARLAEVSQLEAKGPSAHETFALLEQLRAIYRNLLLARKQIYFGRLDFDSPALAESGQYYLGRIGFDRNGQIIVVDWRAPLARLFSKRRPGPAEYHSPEGLIRGDLQLKRYFNIAGSELLNVLDEFDARLTTPIAQSHLIDPDTYLREILSGRRDAFMQDIVATIQEHQDDLIRADPAQVLVIQGVAGSGKTSIALHRLAFLLYPGNKTGIDASRCIIFGPNQLFLEYIANVLPGLGVGDIAQTTLEAWALERLGLTKYRLTDTTLEALLSGKASVNDQRTRTRRSQLKASRRMGQLLDRWVEGWRNRMRVPDDGFRYRGLGPLKVTAHVSQRRAIEIHRTLNTLPLCHHCRRFHELVLGELMGQYTTHTLRRINELADEGTEFIKRAQQLDSEVTRLEQYVLLAQTEVDDDDEKPSADLERGARGLLALADHFRRRGERAQTRAARLKDEIENGAHHAEARAIVQRAFEADLEKLWPEFDPLPAYFEMLADAEQLNRLRHNLLATDEVTLLHQPKPPARNTLDVSDLPVLCYLHTLVNGVPAPLYDHVVIDEAQDVAPLYFAVLKRLSRNASFTILGDVAQGVYSYRGLQNWDEVRHTMAGTRYNFNEVRESYRSTFEIITFANRILELLAPPGHTPLLAKPFERHGASVQVQHLSSAEALTAELTSVIAALQGQGFQNIALITKTFEQCATLAEELRPQLHQPFQVAAPNETHYPGGLFILPVHLAKGMEFEAVLVVGADAQNYPATELDGRLLYVAATRALHVLKIYAVGALNVYLELAESQ